jgi:hypothetical protein
VTSATRIRALAVAIAGTFLIGVLSVVSGVTEDDGPGHPDEWDPRVAELAAFVEDERDLEFDHPVFVDFLTPTEYSAATTTTGDALDEEEREDLDLTVSELRALGLVSGPVDLFGAINDVSDGGTLAFYTPDDQRIRVRGTEVSVGLEVTLVHELTHALQDQHFDLSGILDSDVDSSESTARRGLAEGDAMRIEEAYVASELSDEEQTAYDEEYAGELDESREQVGEVPASIQALFAIPYAFGAPFVATLLNEDGNDAIDDAFRNPPTTEEHLFDPASYLALEVAEEVDLELDDVELLDEGPFGSPSWYLVLAERLDPRLALDAVLGWNGDHYGVYEKDGRTCMRIAFAGDSDQDETEMRDALAAWAQAMPGGLSTPIEVDGLPGVDACDPGPDVDMALTGRSLEALALPNLWGYLIAGNAPDLGPGGSRCLAGRVIDAFSYEQLTSANSEADQGLLAEVQQRAVEAYRACGSGDT